MTEGSEFQRLLGHVGHAVQVFTYGADGTVWNVSIECDDCSEVLYDLEADGGVE